jgi:hypothetical protein
MRKFAVTLILLAWLIYIVSMFLPADATGDWNGIKITLFSLIAIKEIPSEFVFLFKRDNRALGLLLFMIGIYGLCNIIFILSTCCLRSRSKFVIRTYKGFLIGASLVSGTGILWNIEPANYNIANRHMIIGPYIWSLAFLILVLGTYQLERDKLRKKELIDDNMKATDNESIERDGE